MIIENKILVIVNKKTNKIKKYCYTDVFHHRRRVTSLLGQPPVKAKLMVQMIVLPLQKFID